MKIQYYNKIMLGLAPLAPNDAPPLCSPNLHVDLPSTPRKSSWRSA
jgi:hypothetical protein